MTLVNLIKTTLDELRMQMLGIQVLFGFQFQGLFQAGFTSLPTAARTFDALGLMALIIALGILIAIPCQHRIVEEGESTLRLFQAAKRVGNIALLPLAVGIGCDIFVATSAAFGLGFGTVAAAATVTTTVIAWYGVAHVLRSRTLAGVNRMTKAETPLHAKLEQMLTEARVILPGSQALLGFQMIVMLTPAFKELSVLTRYVHVAALLLNVLSVILLICPAAVHRMTFEGQDDPRMHSIGSALVTAALGPLAVSIAAELYVAVVRLFDNPRLAVGCALVMLIYMVGSWYVVPLGIRRAVRDTN